MGNTDENDPRLEGYISLETMRSLDMDCSSRRIRDEPEKNILLSGSLYDFNVPVTKTPLIDDWNN